MKTSLRYAAIFVVLSVASFLVFSITSTYHFHERIPPNPVFKAVRHLVSVKTTNSAQLSACPTTNCHSSSVECSLSCKLKPTHAATVAKYSSFKVINAKQTYKRCDQLEIGIEARDSINRPKSTGGDYFWVWIHNNKLNASSAADEIVDHNNGSYTALVTLYWEGAVEINVTLVHSSEAINILRRVRDNNTTPRNAYQGTFQIDGNRVTKPCHISTSMFIYDYPHDANKSLTFCNYTDSKLGFPWYCVKPDHFPCDSYYKHSTQLDEYKKAKATFKSLMTSHEYTMVLDSLREIRETSTSPTTSVYVKRVANRQSSTPSTCLKHPPPRCVPGLPPRSNSNAAGHYHKDEWISNVCQKHDFTADNGAPITKCLQNTNLHFYGDSTGRQWFEYLINHLNKNGTMEMNVTNSKMDQFLV
ncbi:NXPE family member 3-like [Amphiura filiformis]|uniref:NXPE family member 3-like n=1 Tax=Amphiura filiformis TaxID=82378 RepID=UPI003B214280